MKTVQWLNMQHGCCIQVRGFSVCCTDICASVWPDADFNKTLALKKIFIYCCRGVEIFQRSVRTPECQGKMS